MQREVIPIKTEWLVGGYDCSHAFNTKKEALKFFNRVKRCVPKEERITVYELKYDIVDGKEKEVNEKIVADYIGK